MGKYIATDIFSTRDGRWDKFSDQIEYGIPKEMAQKYGDQANELGGATHIFVKTEGGPSNLVRFFTRDNGVSEVKEEKKSGWAEYPLAHDNAGYVPAKGQKGWWNVKVEGAPSDTVENIGLPNSWHVSSFIVFKWEEDDTGVPDEGGPEIPDLPDPDDPPTPDSIWSLIVIGDKSYGGWLSPIDELVKSVG